MDRIQLRFHDFWHHLWPGPQLLIHINGQSLITLVRQVEMPFAREEGAPYLAGAYDWLLSVECDMHRLTTERCLVLGSSCGIPSRWPLTAQVTVAEDTVTWSHFINGERTIGCEHVWDYSELGPFVFERGQYTDAVNGVRHIIERGYFRGCYRVRPTHLDPDHLRHQPSG